MHRNHRFIPAKRYRVLQRNYLRLKDEVEKKKSGYKELRELLKEISS